MGLRARTYRHRRGFLGFVLSNVFHENWPLHRVLGVFCLELLPSWTESGGRMWKRNLKAVGWDDGKGWALYLGVIHEAGERIWSALFQVNFKHCYFLAGSHDGSSNIRWINPLLPDLSLKLRIASARSMVANLNVEHLS